MNFKVVQTLWDKSGKLTKNLSQLVLNKSEFSWLHLYVRIWVTHKYQKELGLNKTKEFEFEIQTLQYL
jgi:hypothetical protein